MQGLGKPQLAAGYVCTCQTYVNGPGLVVELGKFDEVYESQYGQYEKSYGNLKYSDGSKQNEEKKKGWFGF